MGVVVVAAAVFVVGLRSMPPVVSPDWNAEVGSLAVHQRIEAPHRTWPQQSNPSHCHHPPAGASSHDARLVRVQREPRGCMRRAAAVVVAAVERRCRHFVQWEQLWTGGLGNRRRTRKTGGDGGRKHFRLLQVGNGRLPPSSPAAALPGSSSLGVLPVTPTLDLDRQVWVGKERRGCRGGRRA